ncbi:cupin domain-containing protein [Streptomyces sp. NBC_00190]|uniref:JmjC domain-containing protein n=1 Tax=unclassified Streptomyces TaxID=2593676 RepID=UPI002E2D6CA2|nr:cupin domain-containing protein [Streptomyces sp. NBC_00190]WSZ38328.1 cupin domain-containing protein [Streptomyces sp. NBC_00868]
MTDESCLPGDSGLVGESGLVESRELDVDLFYREFWRRRPVVWRGCGDDFLSPALDWSDIEALERRLADEPQRKPDEPKADVHRREDGQVLFVNQAQHALSELAEACAALAERFGWEQCTADLSVTRGRGAGIGCHFDHSDNFVVQQLGSKNWLVGLPEHTSQERQRKRMLETKGFVPSGRLPETPFQVELTPGDVLYLPVFAPHEGTEGAQQDGGSVSVSFSYNAESALNQYLRPLLRRLSEEEAWWGPLPPGGADLDRLEGALVRALRTVARARKI